jgi:arabinose-5-phosphate isomerase
VEAALLDSTSGLAAQFDAAVALVTRASGRLIVTGMGKSGHVGRKIAATLASTGTPAYFVHPGEASHGDLGMIQAGDAILALSWSGETAELADIITYSRRYGVALIAITSGSDSALGREADVCLCLPKSEEACPNGLAPTTSTTMQLAMGDALAVALLESRGFTAQDFRQFHPGGKLGAKLSFVRDIMHKEEAIPLAPMGARMEEALIEMTGKRFGCVGVVDGESIELSHS